MSAIKWNRAQRTCIDQVVADVSNTVLPEVSLPYAAVLAMARVCNAKRVHFGVVSEPKGLERLSSPQFTTTPRSYNLNHVFSPVPFATNRTGTHP